MGCDDLQHCCPRDAPICNTEKGTCSSQDGQKVVEWTEKKPAKYELTNSGSSSGEGSGSVAETAKFYRGIQKMQRMQSLQKAQGIQQQLQQQEQDSVY